MFSTTLEEIRYPLLRHRDGAASCSDVTNGIVYSGPLTLPTAIPGGNSGGTAGRFSLPTPAAANCISP